MYKIVIAHPDEDGTVLELGTDSKGEARAVASVCDKSKVDCKVTRLAKEIEVKYNFTPAKGK